MGPCLFKITRTCWIRKCLFPNCILSFKVSNLHKIKWPPKHCGFHGSESTVWNEYLSSPNYLRKTYYQLLTSFYTVLWKLEGIHLKTQEQIILIFFFQRYLIVKSNVRKWFQDWKVIMDLVSSSILKILKRYSSSNLT